MSDPTEPPRPEGSDDAPSPPPPSGYDAPAPPPPPPPSGGDPYGGAGGAAGGGGYGDGGYGAPPPPGPYGQPQPAGYSPTEAIGYGWRKFTASPTTLLVPMIVVWVVLVVISVLLEILVYRTLLSTHDCTRVVGGVSVSGQCSPSFVTQLFGGALISAVIIVVFNVAAAGLYKGATNVTDGKPFSLGQMFDGWDKGQVALAAVLIAVATAIGSFLCYIPGLIVGFLTMFTILFVVDKQMGAVDAIKASVKLVTDNLGSTIVFYLLAAVVIVVGACLCLVGLLVAAPVVLVGLAYTYRRLQNEPVVA
ncbi:hypothetical protein [Nocardioides sp.]|jgi:uncharacterized membrane protein|uniref:hypothetical protein n=1 Tax=Nocardioides sp. TaxID=35761 RepID=UPI002F3E730A